MTSNQTEHSESVNVKETSVLTSIKNLNDEPYKGQDSGNDSEEEPRFLFEYRGKQVGEVAGLTPEQGKVKAVRPPDNKGDKVKDEKLEELDDLDKRAAAMLKKKGKKT